jgi:glycosyltransferase involved in cell wall biosynthesis
MKIGIFSAFYPFRGGIAQFSAHLFRALEKKNEVKAYTFTSQYPKILFPGKTQLVSNEDIADVIPAKRIIAGFNPLSYPKLKNEIKKEQFDVFITNYWMTFFAPLSGFVLPKKSKTKNIALIHNLFPHEPRFFDRSFNRYFVKKYDGFIVMNDSVKQQLLSIAPEAKTLKLAHPSYAQFGSPLSKEASRKMLQLDPHKKTLLFFGLIRDYKGLDLLLDAFNQLDDSYQLIIAGEVYGDFKKYQEIIDHSKFKSNVYLFSNYIPDQEVKNYFSAADLCVLPYKSATQSGICAIAKSFKTPVLVTDVGGLKEYILNENAGLVSEQLNADGIQKGIVKFFETEKQNEYYNNLTNEDNKEWDEFANQLINFANSL